MDREECTPGSYFPFGLGGRECIGKHFALHEILLVVTRVLQKHKLNVRKTQDQLQTIQARPLVTLYPNRDIRLHFQPKSLIQNGSPN